MKKQRWSWGKAYLALVFVILYAPILYLVVFSFSSGQTMEKYMAFLGSTMRICWRIRE